MTTDGRWDLTRRLKQGCILVVIHKDYINVLKPTGNFTYHKVSNIQQFYIAITWNLCVLYGSRHKQQILPYGTLQIGFYNRDDKFLQRGTDLVFKTVGGLSLKG
jgi:hypothetical protein